MVVPLIALLFAVLLPVLAGTLMLETAATAAAGSARGPVTAAAPTDPAYPYTGYLASTITGISPTVVTSGAGSRLQVTGTITNVSKGTIYDLRYVWQRGDPLAGVSAIKAEIAAPGRPTAVVGQDWNILAASVAAISQTDLAAGASMPYVATVAIGPDGLDLRQRGVYALMIKVSGDIGQNGQTQYERVGEIHLLTTVLSVPKTTAGSGGTSTTPPSTAPASAPTTGTDIPTQGIPTVSSAPGSSAAVSTAVGLPGPGSTQVTPQSIGAPPAASAGSTTAGATTSGVPSGSGASAHPVAVNLVWPLVDTPHLGVGGVFLNDDLTRELRPGGRLYSILDNLSAVRLGLSSMTLVVDPELLDEIGRMAGGYRVATSAGQPQAALTPTSVPTTPDSRPSGSVSSSGDSSQAAATASSSGSGGPAATTRSSVRAEPSRTANRPATSVPVPARSRTDLPSTPARTTSSNGTSITTGPAALSDPVTGSGSRTAAAGPPVTGSGAAGTGVTGAPDIEPPPNTVTGAGQHAAAEFLKRLRAAATGRKILVLPYSDPDSVAMIRAGLDDQLAQLIAAGRQMAADVLQLDPAAPELVTDMSMPEGGFINDATLAFLSAHGMAKSLLSPSSIAHAAGAVGSVIVDETANKGSVVRAAVTDADLLAQVNDLIAKGNAVGLATRLSNLAALLTGGSLDGSGTPLVIAPDNRWTPSPAGLKILSGLLGTLQSGGVLAGTSLEAIATPARTAATLTYPAGAEQAELEPGYLAAVLRDTGWIAGVRSSLNRSPGIGTPIPADILDPLQQALISAGSAGLRSDRQVGRAILRTTESTLVSLQNGVQLTGGNSYTLAASTSPLLVTVRNDLPYVVRVRVTIIGGQTVGMTAIDPGVQSIPAGRTQQFKIDTNVVKAGKFVVYAQLLAADGSDWSDSAPVTVNSSAYGTLTIILIVVAGGALTLMVMIRIVQRVRHRNDPITVGTAGVAAGAVPGRSAPEPDSVQGAANEPVGASGPPEQHPLRNPPDAQASTVRAVQDESDQHGEGRR